MKQFLKKIGFGLLGLLALLIIIGFLLPDERDVEVTEKINAPVALVFDEVNDLRKWEEWSPWKKMDPNIELSYSNPPAGKGAFLKWNSAHPDIGSGKLTIVEVVPQEKIVLTTETADGKSRPSAFTFTQEKRKTEVSWSTHILIGKNPIKRYTGLFSVGDVRRLFADGLEAMRITLENR